MRPRISRKEAQFILGCLLVKKEAIENLLESYEDLKAEVLRLRQIVMYDSYTAVTKGKLPKKREELERLEVDRFRLCREMRILNSLIAKYDRIVKGTKGKGRYKYSETSFYLS